MSQLKLSMFSSLRASESLIPDTSVMCFLTEVSKPQRLGEVRLGWKVILAPDNMNDSDG